MEKVMIVLNGPMCAGKSTTVRKLMEQDGFFKASSDVVKWLISNYTAESDHHRVLARDLTLALTAEAAKQGLSIIIEGGHRSHRDAYRKIADENELAYVSVNLEAPYETLKERFLARMGDVQKTGNKKVSVTTVEGFDSRYKWYFETNRDTEADATLDSSFLSTEEIISKIEELAE